MADSGRVLVYETSSLIAHLKKKNLSGYTGYPTGTMNNRTTKPPLKHAHKAVSECVCVCVHGVCVVCVHVALHFSSSLSHYSDHITCTFPTQTLVPDRQSLTEHSHRVREAAEITYQQIGQQYTLRR